MKEKCCLCKEIIQKKKDGIAFAFPNGDINLIHTDCIPEGVDETKKFLGL